jgi:hypothetical protein
MTEPALAPDTPHQAAWVVTEPVYEADLLNPELAISPWQSHRDFAYDLVSFVQPRLIVELGVHYGCSYYAFCQAVKDHALVSRVVGIDTWRGDPHAGFYDDDVFDLVKKTKESYFSDDRFSFRRASFNEAVAEFADNSIGLLHLDGLHTYEGVREDFTTWLPKLAEDGVLLIHDVAPSSGYESARFWADIKRQYPHFEFLNKWGLGIVFPNGDRWYRASLAEGVPDKIRGYRYRGEWLACRRQSAIDLQWQKKQTDLWWQESENLKTRAAKLEKWLRICTFGLAGTFLRRDGD